MNSNFIKNHKIIILILVILNNFVYGQKIDSISNPAIEKKHLLRKSKIQKTVGWTILATGVPIVLGTVYLLAAFDKDDIDKPLATKVCVASVAYTLVSIPLIKAGNRNKREALRIQITKNKFKTYGVYSAVFKSQLAFSATIPL